jgi:hypothetical protein
MMDPLVVRFSNNDGMNIVPKILYVNTGVAGFFLIRFSLIEAQPDAVRAA